MKKLQVGDAAPVFTLPNQAGKSISLAAYRGQQHVVVYFYPKDDTPGCTAEACGFRDRYEDFTAAGAEVIGISADSQSKHADFASRRKLPFQLCSDPDRAVARAYGVKAQLMGLLPGRETFVIDRGGVIRHRFSSQLQIDRHIEEALQVIQGLET
jgi:thioredoxin-dependent peroxiredoxin